MIQLYKGPPAFGLSDLSPFCLKVELWLKLKGLPFKPRTGRPDKAPKGKIPWVELPDGSTVSDSTDILERLTELHGPLPADATLTPAQQATGHLIQRTAEEHLYFAALHFRYASDPAIYAKVKAVFLKSFPPLIGSFLVDRIVQASAKKMVHYQGLGRHADADVLHRANQDLVAIAQVLGTQPFLFGDAPTRFDVSLAAMLAEARVPDNTPLRVAIEAHPTLNALTDRLLHAADATPATP